MGKKGSKKLKLNGNEEMKKINRRRFEWEEIILLMMMGEGGEEMDDGIYIVNNYFEWEIYFLILYLIFTFIYLFFIPIQTLSIFNTLYSPLLSISGLLFTKARLSIYQVRNNQGVQISQNPRVTSFGLVLSVPDHDSSPAFFKMVDELGIRFNGT